MAAGGVAVSMLFLLGALAIAPAAAARGARLDLRHAADAKGRASAASGVLVAAWDDTYLGRPVAVNQVAVVGRAPSPPPGLERLPAPGEQIMSPALLALVRSPRHAALRTRYPARVVGRVGADGLVGPHELVVWTGVPASAFERGDIVVPGFGAAHDHAKPLPADVRVALPLGLVAFLVPILVLVATASRVGSAERDRRLAALRLLGVTPGEARLLTAAEAGVASVCGEAVGLALFVLLRAVASPVLPVRGGVWRADATPAAVPAAAILMLLPVLAVVVAVVAQRRVIVTPLGSSRRGRTRALRPVRLLPLAGGLALLAVAALARTAVRTGNGIAVVVLAAGAVLVLVGLAIATPLVAQLAASVAARRARGLPAMLAGRRVEADPHAAARVVTGAALLVFVGGWVLSILPLLAPSGEGTERDLAGELRRGTFVTAVYDRSATDRVAGIPGVRGVAPMYRLNVSNGADGDDTLITAVDCADLNSVLRQPLPGCTATSSYVRADAEPLAAGKPLRLVRYRDVGRYTLRRELAGTLRLASLGMRTARVDDLSALNLGLGTVPLSGVPPGALDVDDGGASVLVATDGRPATIERVRTALMTGGPRVRVVRTIEESVAAEEATPRRYGRIALALLAVAAMVGALSLAVALTDTVREQRRGLAALVACGVPRRMLQRAVLGQSALSVLPAVGLALGATVTASWLYLRLDDDATIGVPWSQLGLLGAGCVAAVLVGTLATLPALRAATGPDALRTE